MSNPDLFEEMLATYPAEKRELAREIYHRFAEGDSTQFFSQLFLLLDVYAHYAERIPARMISANADSLATMEEIRGEIAHIAKTIETRDADITSHAEKTDELCRITLAKCNETIAAIELTVKNIGAQVDTKAIAEGINSGLESRIKEGLIAPFVRQTESLVLYVFPTLKSIRESADEAKSEWTKRIWRNAWANSLLWSATFALLAVAIACEAIEKHYANKSAAQIADMAQVMKFNQAAFQKLAIAQIPIQVLAAEADGSGRPPGFVLVIQGAYAADLRQVEGLNHGCIFFRSRVSEKQIRDLQQGVDSPAQATNSPAN
jgi:hypothetical protein